MENKGNILMQRYELGRQLGQGNFSKVHYGRNLKTGQSVAVKVIDKEKVLTLGLIEQIKREVSVMRRVKHLNILQLYEVMATKSKIYLVVEYARGGELFSKVARGRLQEDDARKYFQQLIGAIDFCHRQGVYHRDLKPENLLLDENEDLKVSDFGLSALAESKRQDGLLHTTCGTPAYVAPEVINRKGYDGAKADIWSCGVILFVLLAGYLPFHDSNLIALYRKITKAEYKCPNWVPLEVRRLLSKILDPNPLTRISIAKLVENPWFRKGLNCQIIPENEEGISTHSDGERGLVKAPSLNAFDIISLSSGFDLSGLFVGPDEKNEVQFTSVQPFSIIISRLEEIAKQLRLKLTKKEGGLLKFEGWSDKGSKGALLIDAEIFEITPSFHLVEVKNSSGDALEFQSVLKQDIRPGLKDIVWAWQR